MEITTLTSKEFEAFAKKNKYVTFHQKESWGKLKEKNGWKTFGGMGEQGFALTNRRSLYHGRRC